MARAEAAAAVQEVVDRETRAWDTQDVELLLSVFHPDMVWAWPSSPTAHDPVDWVLRLGRFDRERWGGGWQELFDAYELVHNRRETVKIEVSDQGDGAFAVVDIDTWWRPRAGGEDDRWQGRTCKIYALTSDGWKMTAQVGVLDYGVHAAP
jgi:ketosteroid isomerase-like protein